VNQVHGPGSHGPPASLNRGHWLLDGRLGFNPSEGVCGFYSRPLIFECAALGAPADHGRRHREGSPELGQPAATKLSFLQGFALRDRGDEADPWHLPRESGRRQRRPLSTGRLGPSLVTSGAASGGPPATRMK
jgi:hypothetical protein